MKFNFIQSLDFASLLIITSSVFIFIALFTSHKEKFKTFFILRLLVLCLLLLYLFNPVIKYSTNKYSELPWALFFDNSSSIKFHKSPSLNSINLGIDNFLDQLYSKNISFISHSFDTEVKSLKGKLSGSGQTTNIGNIAEYISQNKNKLAGAVIISDGIPTEGVEPSLAFLNSGLPIHTIGIGNKSSLIDIFINSIESPTVAIKNDRINISAEIQSIGEINDRFSVSLYDDSRLIASKYVELYGLGSKSIVNFQFQPKSLGRQKYKIQVSSVSDEVNISNNKQNFDVLILKEKYTVALFTGSPNKNTSIIKKTLKNNNRIEVDHYIKIFSNKFSTPIKNFWETSYDLILFENYPIEPLSPNFIRILAKKIISQQSGIMILAGPNQNNKSLEGLSIIAGFQIQNEKTADGDYNYWEFSDNVPDSENLPPLSRKFSITSIDNNTSDIAIYESGWTLLARNINRKIRSVIFTSPDINKLFFYKNELTVFSKIFSESINWLLRSGVSSENFFRLNRDYFQQGEMAYLSGTKVGHEDDSLGFYVDVYKENKFILSTNFDMNMEKSIWEARFRTPNPGRYSYNVHSKHNKEIVQSTSFNVLDSQIETSQVFLNEKLLKEISASNKGKYFNWNNREFIFGEMPQKGKQEIKANVIIFKDSIQLLLLILIFICTEWVLRKKRGLL